MIPNPAPLPHARSCRNTFEQGTQSAPDMVHRIPRKSAPKLTVEELAILEGTMHPRHPRPRALPAPMDDPERWVVTQRPDMPVRRYSARRRHAMVFDEAEVEQAFVELGLGAEGCNRRNQTHSHNHQTPPVFPQRVLRTYASSLHLKKAAAGKSTGRIGLGLSKLNAKLNVVTKTLFGLRA
jgi:hypothetical protein